jgi:hypothetical protein
MPICPATSANQREPNNTTDQQNPNPSHKQNTNHIIKTKPTPLQLRQST